MRVKWGWETRVWESAGTAGLVARVVVVALIALAMGRLALGQAATLTFAGKTKVGTSSQPVVMTLTASAAGSAGSPEALTSGTPNLDFSIADPGTCGGNPVLSAGQTCTVSVIFTPLYPGLRQGAVVLLSANGTQTLASARLSGIGQGGLPVLVPGEINTVAGDGQWVYHGDGVAATSAPIFLPTGLAVDGAGNLFFSDSSNNRVRRVDSASGLISTIAGDGTAGGSGDGAAATSAEVNNPSGVVLDGAGNLYIADSGNNVVRRVDAVSGVISTVAGHMGASGYAGDGAAATSASLSSPQGLALTLGGDLLIADSGNAAVRLVTFADGKIQTVAGTGVAGYNGDGISATAAQLNTPWGVAVRSDGAIAIADFSNERVRLVDTQGTISTLAGTGQRNYSGDGDPATQATLSGPAAVAFDPAGDLIIADSGNNRVRGVYGSPGVITTLAGNSSEEFSGDAGPANSAGLYGPYGVLFDAQGNIWISDMFHQRVREISGSMLGIAYPTMKVGKVSSPELEALYNAGNDNLTLSAPALNQAQLDPNTTTCGQSALTPMLFCNMGVEFAPTQVGQNIAGSITWNSDAPHVTPVDDLNGQVLSVEPTSVALVADANPGLLGKPVTFTATVSSAATGLTGSITFSEGNQVWCNAVALSSGAASCQVPSLSLGSHTFTASYTGDDNNAASTSPAYTEIIKQQPALALAVSSSPAVVTSNVTLTLTAADQSGTPTGNVVFLDGATALATVPLNSSGVAAWSTQTFSVGVHTLSAQYAGDSANVAGTSNTVSEQITQASTLTVIASSNADSTVGTAITLTGTVASNNGPAPTGQVQFTDSVTGTVLGTAALDSNGSASIAVSTLAPGTHSLVANYLGDTDDAPSSSSALAQTVQQIGTVTSLGADANPLNAGATLHLTAIVSMQQGASADGALTGNVVFRDGNISLGSAAINSTGQATLSVNTLSVGAHTVVASFQGDTNYAASDSVVLHETVQQTATQITINTTSASTLVSKPVTFTASVTSGTGVPTGTVTFHDGGTVLAYSTLDSSGRATFTTSGLGQGTHTITASYGGDANYLSSASTGLQQTVQMAAPTLILSGPATPVDAGTMLQVTGTLSSPGAAPTGTLTLMDGGTVVATESAAGSGAFVFTTNRLGIGTHSLTAKYSGDAANAPATSAAITVTIRQANSAAALVSNANPVVHGNTLTLTATISSDSPNPSGSVTFFDGGSSLGTGSVDASGSASLAVASLALGMHSLTAVYAGDVNHAGSTSAALQQLVVQSSTASLASSLNPSPSGQTVTLTAHISGAGSTVPTGQVSFRDGGALIATVPLNGSADASFATSGFSVGSHPLTAAYAGDQNYATATAVLTQTVTNATTNISLTANANPATYGQALQLTASVTSNGGVATGTVTLTDNGAPIGSAALDAYGVAVFSTTALPPGLHSIVANYLGDGKASASVSSPLAEIVKQTSNVTVSASANPAATLSAVSFEVVVTNAGVTAASGTVTFTDGNTTLGVASVDATGRAVLSVPQLNAGPHTVVASYSGDGYDFASSSAPYTETVQLRPTVTTVTGSATDPSNPQQVTLIAVVKGDGSVPPGGMVSFTSGSLTLGAAPVDATGVAAITVLFDQTSESVVVSYAGDASYSGSSSASTPITAGEAPQFTLSINVPSLTIVTQQHATIAVSIGSVKGFSDTITLGCLGLPYAATCSFDRSQLKLQPDGTETAALIVDTGDPLGAGSGKTASLSGGNQTVWLCGLPAGLLLGLFGRRKRSAARRGLGTLLLLMCALVVSAGAMGCGGLVMNSTPAGKYSFKVVGTGLGSGATQTQTVNLVVTQ